MDAYQIATIVVSLLFGGQGVMTFVRSRRSKKLGVPGDEQDARQAGAAGPDWARFNSYWKQEIAGLKESIKDLERNLTQVREEAARRAAADAQHIDDLEEHIWLRKPPPPPGRRISP